MGAFLAEIPLQPETEIKTGAKIMSMNFLRVEFWGKLSTI
jgi:hypothetical protein